MSGSAPAPNWRAIRRVGVGAVLVVLAGLVLVVMGHADAGWVLVEVAVGYGLLIAWGILLWSVGRPRPRPRAPEPWRYGVFGFVAGLWTSTERAGVKPPAPPRSGASEPQ